MKPGAAGTSLLEVLLVAAASAGIILPLFELLSLQRRQVAAAGEDVAIHSYALQRLAEEESRLNVLRFAPETTRARKELRLPGIALSVEETVSTSACGSCTGLWSLTVELTWISGQAAGTRRRLGLSRLSVDRSLATTLPIGSR